MDTEELLGVEAGEDGATFEMANVFPAETGLPFVVYISERGRARHDVRVKVAGGPKARDFVASLSVRPDVRVVAGTLSAEHLALAQQWIDLNRDTIVGYWDGDIGSTREALDALVALPAP